MDDSTIAAIASPAGRGGISIIKISGPQAIPIASALFKPALAEPEPAAFKSHRLYYGHIVDAETGRVLDEVLLSVMKAPRTYTREDVVEINSHGSPASIRAILELVLCHGARLAKPGEFTRRAFLNGRIDLTQAEAVIDLINASTNRALALSAAHLSGALRKEIEAYRASCIDLLARIEAGIDFPDEVDEIIDGPAAGRELRTQIVAPMRQLIRNHIEGRLIREGATVAIVGRPNVGKSSLMNRLLCRERAIVTPYPGTTRDAIEDTVVLQGLAVSLWDTAGLHVTADPVEILGMLKTEERSKCADLVLFVLEADRPLSPDDRRIFEKIALLPLVVVLNKIDLLSESQAVTELPDDWSRSPSVAVSALTGEGLERLREIIVQSIQDGTEEGEATLVPNLRQKEILERSVEAAEASAASLESGVSPEIVTVHLNDTLNSLDEVLGTGVKSDILETIFSRFCIGK